jgi:hypothetical protein
LSIRKGLRRVGFADGTDVVVECYSLHGHYEEMSPIIDDAVRRGVALIGTPTALRARLLPKPRLKPSRLYSARLNIRLKPGLVKSLAQPTHQRDADLRWRDRHQTAWRMQLFFSASTLAEIEVA